MSSVAGVSRPDPFARLDEMLRQGNTVVEKKLNERGAQPQIEHTKVAANDIDQAYGGALNGLSDSGEALAQHSLDPERVAQLLDL